jgi:O-antigen/teichoic acid export membrane protein
MSNSKLLQGTLILTLGTYIARVLGMIYVFPFESLVGNKGGALFQYGYGQYTIYLSIATAGVPLAVSKFVSKYNALGDYHTSMRMFKSGMKFTMIMGVTVFAALFFLSPVIAELMLGGNSLDNSLDDVVMVIRMVSVAIIVVPTMSLIRGFFQGNGSMGPTAVSQVIEQIARVVFLLASSYIIIKMLNGRIATAVGFATFAAFIGALGGLAVLYWYWKKRKKHFDKLLEQSVEPANISTRDMFKELFSYAGPFVFVGLAIPLFQYVDQFMFNRAMVAAGHKDTAETLFGITFGWVPKLVMIPVSIATAFGLTLVPTITDSYVNGKRRTLKNQIDQTYQTIMFLVLPAVIGMCVLAYPIYALMYSTSDLGGQMLATYAPLALFFSFFTVNAAILQGINKQRYAVISLVLGLLVKIVFNFPLTYYLQATGSILATALGYFVAIAYTFYMIQKHAAYKFTLFVKRSILIILFVAIMALAVWLVQLGLSSFVSYKDGRIAAGLISFAGVGIGGALYLGLAYKSRLLNIVFGDGFVNKITRRFKRNKVREQ